MIVFLDEFVMILLMSVDKLFHQCQAIDSTSWYNVVDNGDKRQAQNGRCNYAKDDQRNRDKVLWCI